MTFHAHDVEFREIITSHGVNYEIPRFQRSYSWNKDNAEDFYKDMKDDDYEFFVGSIVLNTQRGDGVIEIIDGQQRMITSTILFAAIRDVFEENGFSEEAREIQTDFIGKRSAETRETDYKLRPADDLETWFVEHIQSHPKNEFPPVRNLNAEQKRVRANYNLFIEEIKKEVDDLDASGTRSKLFEIRKRITKMRVVRIQVNDEVRAYEIFETLNSRGADLTVADLLKNKIFRNVPPHERRGDVAKEKWSKILENLEGTGLDITSFVRYHWLSKNRFETKRNLYRRISERISDWPSFLDELHKDSDMISALTQSDIFNLELEDLHHRVTWKVNKSLQGINAVGTTQSYVLFLALLRYYRRAGFSRIHKIFEIVERFTFFYHGVCRGPANKVERFWNRKCLTLKTIADEENDSTKREMRNVWLQDLKDHLRRLMNEEEFKEKFYKNLVYKESPKARKLVKYFFTEINRDIEAEGFEQSGVDIEHILPRNPTKWGLTKTEVKSYVNRIGNLTLILSEYNGRMGNKKLEEKLPILQQSTIALNPEIVNSIENETIQVENEDGELENRIQPIWNEESIRQRADLLCERALQIWQIEG